MNCILFYEDILVAINMNTPLMIQRPGSESFSSNRRDKPPSEVCLMSTYVWETARQLGYSGE